MQITTPPPGEWLDGGQVTVIGKGPRGEARWYTATTNGREWTEPAQVGARPGSEAGDPTLLPAGPDDDPGEPVQIPADEVGEDETRGGGRPRPGRPTPR